MSMSVSAIRFLFLSGMLAVWTTPAKVVQDEACLFLGDACGLRLPLES